MMLRHGVPRALAALAIALMAGACSSDRALAPELRSAVTSASGPAPTKAQARYEIDFLQDMIDHHMMAVMTAELCVEKAVHEELRAWIEAYRQGEPPSLDVFFSRLFGELLSQPGFDFHHDYDAAAATANLIDSARQFRQTVGNIEPDAPIAAEYIRMVDSGMIANQYVRQRDKREQDAVLIAPAYSYLVNNQPVDYQFWLNIGSAGWGQRLEQPLTQPYVLSRQWEEGRAWGDADEFQANQDTVYYLVSGLIRRCRKRVYLGFSEYSEQGFEQRGTLMLAVQSMLRRLAKEENDV